MANEKPRYYIGKQNIPMPERDQTVQTASEIGFLNSLEAAKKFQEERDAVKSDLNLSDVGRLAKMGPKIDALWHTILGTMELIEVEKISLDKQKKKKSLWALRSSWCGYILCGS